MVSAPPARPAGLVVLPQRLAVLRVLQVRDHLVQLLLLCWSVGRWVVVDQVRVKVTDEEMVSYQGKRKTIYRSQTH